MLHIAGLSVSLKLQLDILEVLDKFQEFGTLSIIRISHVFETLVFDALLVSSNLVRSLFFVLNILVSLPLR